MKFIEEKQGTYRTRHERGRITFVLTVTVITLLLCGVGILTISPTLSAQETYSELVVEPSRNVVAEDDDYTIEGTATGVSEVDIVLISPKRCWEGNIDLDVRNGLEIISSSVSGNQFSEDIDMWDADTGTWVAIVFSPGRDGVYGDLGVGAGSLAEAPDIPRMFKGKIQDEIYELLKAHTVDVPGSDDLLYMFPFKVESAYVTLDDIEPVVIGEPLNVSGKTNREPNFSIVVTAKGPVELCPEIARVKWSNEDVGVFIATIDTTDAEVGTYTLEADDGEGNTDDRIVEIHASTSERIEVLSPTPKLMPIGSSTPTPTKIRTLTDIRDEIENKISEHKALEGLTPTPSTARTHTSTPASALPAAQTPTPNAEEQAKNKQLMLYGIIGAVSVVCVVVAVKAGGHVVGIAKERRERKRREKTVRERENKHYREKINEYTAQLEQWKSEGYKVDELEEMLK